MDLSEAGIFEALSAAIQDEESATRPLAKVLADIVKQLRSDIHRANHPKPKGSPYDLGSRR